MDPIKVVIFVAVLAALFLLGRKLSSNDASHTLPGPSMPLAAYGLKVDEQANEEVPPRPAVVGADLPFPISLPEITMDKDGKYNRPEFLNYYFETTDLVLGPANPESFIDDFFVETRDLENNHTGTYKYTVSTPSGLQKTLDSMRVPSLALGQQMIIVSRWDMPLILKTVVDEILKSYKESHEEPPGPSEDTEDAS